MSTHSSILAWEIPWTRNLVDYIIHGVAKQFSKEGAVLRAGCQEICMKRGEDGRNPVKRRGRFKPSDKQ